MDKFVRHVEAINFEAQQFLLGFRRFRKNVHAIDETLCSSLLKIVTEIDSFLESKPKQISVPKTAELLTPSALCVRTALICKPCKKEIGLFEHIRSHLKTRGHLNPNKENIKKPLTSRKPRLDNKPFPRKAKNLILGDIQSFYTKSIGVANKLQNLPDYSVIENELLTLIRPAFPDQSIKVYLFGSRISGIGTIYSDLDIFVDIGNVFNRFEDMASSETLNKLKVVQKLLEQSPTWAGMRAIPSARVPILTISNTSTNTACDIGFSNSLGFCNTKLMKYLFDLQPIGKALCMFLKKWLERSKMSDNITSYSIALLVVFYLQTKGLLPSVKTLQANLEDPVEIGPWNGTFADKSSADLNIKNICLTVDSFKQELKQFFTFYSAFDFKNNLICPYLGHTIPMDTLATSPLLPRYVKYIADANDTKDSQLQHTTMNVQDPFQLNHNITKAVPPAVVLLLKQYFEFSANILSDATTPATTMPLQLDAA